MLGSRDLLDHSDNRVLIDRWIFPQEQWDRQQFSEGLRLDLLALGNHDGRRSENTSRINDRLQDFPRRVWDEVEVKLRQQIGELLPLIQEYSAAANL